MTNSEFLLEPCFPIRDIGHTEPDLEFIIYSNYYPQLLYSPHEFYE